jgi:hypothetical protein
MNQHCSSDEFKKDLWRRQTSARQFREDFADEIGLLRYIRLHRQTPQRCTDITRPVRFGESFGELPAYPSEPARPNITVHPRRESSFQRSIDRPSSLRIPHLGGVRASKRFQSQR